MSKRLKSVAVEPTGPKEPKFRIDHRESNPKYHMFLVKSAVKAPTLPRTFRQARMIPVAREYKQLVGIPLLFQWAVWWIMNNVSDPGCWEEINSHGHRQAMLWISQILESNGAGENLEREMLWWSAHLNPDNHPGAN